MIKLFTAAIVITAIQGSSVNVEYLLKIPSPDPSNSMHFFHYEVVGKTLQWEVNNVQLAGLSRTGTVYNIISKNNFIYSMALLSSLPSTKEQHTFSSILIVYASNSLSLNSITCLSDNGMITENTKIPKYNDTLCTKNNTNVFFTYLFEMSTSKINIKAFQCLVSNKNQTWMVNQHKFKHSFFTKRLTFPPHFTGDWLSFLSVTQPELSVGLLFVMNSFNFTCGDGNYNVTSDDLKNCFEKRTPDSSKKFTPPSITVANNDSTSNNTTVAPSNDKTTSYSSLDNKL